MARIRTRNSRGLWGGLAVLRARLASIVHRSLNMFTLIALGTGAAYLYSVAAVFPPGSSRPPFRLASGEVPVYFEAAAAITTLVLLGQVLELQARSRTGSAHERHCSGSRRRLPAVCARRRRRRCAPGPGDQSATACACGPARKFLSMAASSKARAPSTSRW